MKKNIFKTIFISLVISLIVFVIGSFILNALEEKDSYKEVSTVDLNEDYTILSGVIRNTGDGWYLIQDAGHETIGLKDITQDEEMITVKYSNLMNKVNSVSVTLDETMTSEGYSAGASVGLDELRIYIYDKNNVLVNPGDYSNADGNIWIQGVFKK